MSNRWKSSQRDSKNRTFFWRLVMRKPWIAGSMLLVLLLLAACGSSSAPEKSGGSAASSNNSASLNKNDYPVFVEPDAGADPAVSAEQGGKGFKGEGWETNTDFDLIGDPRAVKGGLIREALFDFPGTLRVEGPESNTQLNYTIK